MKLPLFVSLFLATVLAAAPGFAQSEAKVPAPQKEAETVPAFRPPGQQVATFFSRLTEGRVDAAYDELLKGTKIVEMPRDVEMLKTKTREAIRVFGDINGYETVDLKEIGNHLKRLTALSLGKQFPIRWRFYFYEMGNSWKLIDIRIDDRLMDMFGESVPASSEPSK